MHHDRPANVWVSIVHWNGGDLTRKCVASVMAQDYPDVNVVIIDNGSSDDTVSEIARESPRIHVLRNSTNEGFTGGQNRGISYALSHDADFVLLLNQDATLMDGCIKDMVSLAGTDDRIGMVSPVVYYSHAPSDIQFCGSWLDTVELRIHGSHAIEPVRQLMASDPASICLWGTALMLRSDLVKAIGSFDQRFFAYYEDSDLSVRASNGGWRNVVCFSAGALHLGHQSRLTRPPHFFYFMARNEILFWAKTLKRRHMARALRITIARACGEAGNLRDAGLHDQAVACITGVWDALGKRFGRYDATRTAPVWLCRLVLKHPYLWANALQGNFKGIFQRLVSGTSETPQSGRP